MHKSSSLYVHVPFCIRKCSYCAFFSIPVIEENTERLQTALLTEMKYRCRGYIDTIYAGGGTPTLLPPEFWEKFFEVLRNTAFTDHLTEKTIETNPGMLHSGKLTEYREAGFNRLSIGIQSFIDRDLEILGRIHNSHEAVSTYNQARKAGFADINIDLIYGIPGQTITDWKRNLEKAIELSPEHISCYELSIERDTPLEEKINNGSLVKPDEDICRTMYFMADEILKENGYLHYEVSAYARGEEFISKHNSNYWNRTPYIGLGPSAHSFDGDIKRTMNIPDIEEYCRNIKISSLSPWKRDVLSEPDIILEKVMLGLRCIQGFDLDEVEIDNEYLETMISNGKVTLENRRITPTVLGMLFADGDAVLLSPEIDAPSFD